MSREKRYWLLKTEPSEFSIEDLRDAAGGTAPWDGVRNYQARNFLRDDVAVGDGVLIYHSGVLPAGIAGEALVVRAGYPDPSAFDPKSPYFDPKSDPVRPTWYGVDVRFVRRCRALITRDRLRQIPALRSMMVLRRGCRLSVQPLTAAQWSTLVEIISK